MIKDTIIYQCTKCFSQNIVKNGLKNGKQQYHCKDCGAYRLANPTRYYSQESKEKILRAYQERSSMRGISRIFGVSRPTLAKWLKKSPKTAIS
jgi:transposase-like protein